MLCFSGEGLRCHIFVLLMHTLTVSGSRQAGLHGKGGSPPGLRCEMTASMRNSSVCRCGAPAAPSADMAFPEAETTSWGLPTAACPASSYLLNTYPKLHSEWKRQGRVMYVCSTSAGWANYLQAVSVGVVLGVLLDYAVILGCDIQLHADDLKGATLHHIPVERYFKGPHFDWSFSSSLALSSRDHHAKARELDAHALPASLGVGRLTDPYVRLKVSTLFVEELLAVHPALMLLAMRKLGLQQTLFSANLNGCMLRYTLQPTRRLSEAAFRTVGHVPRSPAGLFHTIALHVRLGDSSFDSSSAYRWHNDVRGAAFREAAGETLGCLARASFDSTMGTCRACLIVSDNAATNDCARQLLDAPLSTPGVAAHPLASKGGMSEAAWDKVMLDWWLTAQANGQMCSCTLVPMLPPALFMLLSLTSPPCVARLPTLNHQPMHWCHRVIESSQHLKLECRVRSL